MQGEEWLNEQGADWESEEEDDENFDFESSRSTK